MSRFLSMPISKEKDSIYIITANKGTVRTNQAYTMERFFHF